LTEAHFHQKISRSEPMKLVYQQVNDKVGQLITNKSSRLDGKLTILGEVFPKKLESKLCGSETFKVTFKLHIS
jgi:hypothetical protein